MEILTGTSGYSYKEWSGSFYPEDLPASERLGFYARTLSAVEINNTFYRMPRTSMLEDWKGQVPASFRFTLKASRRITHFKQLDGVVEETAYLLNKVRSLGEQLGAILFQLPPHFEADADRLATFLDLLPDDLPASFEFRHASWFDDARVEERLRAKNAAFCITDGDAEDEDDPGTPMVSTADWGYVRLRKPTYTEEELRTCAARIAEKGWKRGYVFFKHEEDGATPALAAKFATWFTERPPRKQAASAGRRRPLEERKTG